MDALIIVDVQNDFLPGGALAVPDGDKVIPYINSIQTQFELVVATQDWHPASHGSFANNHEDKSPGEIIQLNGIQQVLWPVHCVQESPGAEFASTLNREHWAEVFTKGMDPGIDSYSGFFDNGRKKSTGMEDYLKDQGVTSITVVGLATDYCVKFTALDARDLGFEVRVLAEGTRAVNLKPSDFENALNEMRLAGVEVV